MHMKCMKPLQYPSVNLAIATSKTLDVLHNSITGTNHFCKDLRKSIKELLSVACVSFLKYYDNNAYGKSKEENLDFAIVILVSRMDSSTCMYNEQRDDIHTMLMDMLGDCHKCYHGGKPLIREIIRLSYYIDCQNELENMLKIAKQTVIDERI